MNVAGLLNLNAPIVKAVYKTLFAKSIVVDVRKSPARNDIDFEKSMLMLRIAVSEHFGSVVLLVGTAVGELQVRRLATEDGTRTIIARDTKHAVHLARTL